MFQLKFGRQIAASAPSSSNHAHQTSAEHGCTLPFRIEPNAEYVLEFVAFERKRMTRESMAPHSVRRTQSNQIEKYLKYLYRPLALFIAHKIVSLIVADVPTRREENRIGCAQVTGHVNKNGLLCVCRNTLHLE